METNIDINVETNMDIDLETNIDMNMWNGHGRGQGDFLLDLVLHNFLADINLRDLEKKSDEISKEVYCYHFRFFLYTRWY
jgi:hypothetical protein